MRYFRALTLSFILHAIVLLVFWLLVPESEILIPEQTPTVVELLESPELPRRPSQPQKNEAQFVRKAEAPPELRTAEKKKPRFASEDEQYVLQEQQARQSGMTENRSETVGETQQWRRQRMNAQKKLDLRPPTTVQKMAEQDLSGGLGDIAQIERPKPVVNSGQPLDFSRFGNLATGRSTIGERLPDDVKIGDFTALNTDRQLYYTFYARMEEKIRGRWINYVRAVVGGIENGTEPIHGRPSWNTRLEIVLDKEGTFTRAILHSSSGSKGLDSAPVQAFRDAQQFPHPPPEMIKDDGMIHLDYAFYVELVPRYATRSANDE